MDRSESMKTAQKTYYNNNKEKINEINKKSNKKNYDDERRQKKKDYYEKNKEAILFKKRLKMVREKEEKQMQDEVNEMRKTIVNLTEGMDAERKALFMHNIHEDLKESGREERLAMLEKTGLV